MAEYTMAVLGAAEDSHAVIEHVVHQGLVDDSIPAPYHRRDDLGQAGTGDEQPACGAPRHQLIAAGKFAAVCVVASRQRSGRRRMDVERGEPGAEGIRFSEEVFVG